MPFNTRNPIPSGDLRDLDDNARNIDVWANDKTKLSHPDRFGVERRTWHGIEQEAQLNIQQAIDAKNAAQEAAMMSGFSKYADTLAQLEAGIGTDYVDGDVVLVFQDETRSGTSSIYKLESGVPVFKNAFDKTRQDLLSFTGNISADAEWSDVPAHSDPAFDVQAQALADRIEFIHEVLTHPVGQGELGYFDTYQRLRESITGATLVHVGVLGEESPSIWGVFLLDATDTTSADDGGTVIVTLSGKRYKRQFDGALQAKWYGVKADGITDDTDALERSITAAIAKKKKLDLGDGVIKYTALPNIKQSGFVMTGHGSKITKLLYLGTGNAVSFDAFIDESPSAPFLNSLEVGGFSIEGGVMTKGMYLHGVARSRFFDIRVNGSTKVDGTVGYHLSGVMLSHFEDIYSSYVDGPVPYRGVWLTAGKRAGVSVGACSNNTFVNLYPEGCAVGIQISTDGGDQNTFIGGAPEACSIYGLVIGNNCRYNTFIGVGFENKDVINHDINDSGHYTKYINCYSNEKVLIGANSKGVEIKGGYFERVEVAAGAQGATVEDITVGHWDTGLGGFFNNASDTRWRNIYDGKTGQYVHKNAPRTNVDVGASPFLYTNPDEVPIKLLIRGGTVTEVLVYRGGDSWAEPKPNDSGAATGTTGIYLLMPGDSIRISYSSAPVVNRIPLAGF